MYSRYNNRPDRPIRLPENYSGVAFSERPISQKEPQFPPRQLEIAKPTPSPDRIASMGMPPPPRAVAVPPPRDDPHTAPSGPPPQHDMHEEPRRHDESNDRVSEKSLPVTLPQPFGGLFGHIGNAFPFSHGMGFDEMLIIGLIILLSRNEEDSDIVLWLALLLFCG